MATPRRVYTVIKGERFGTKTVVRPATYDQHGRQRVVLQCDCGNESIQLAGRLEAHRKGDGKFRCKLCKTAD